jgi:O-antigen biosynthesis protein
LSAEGGAVRLSVVIPSRNGLGILRRTLPVILESLPGCSEVLVVDDGSEDGTAEAMPGEFPKVRLLVRTGEPGFCHAVNLGMEQAVGSLLLLLNNDVLPGEGSIAVLCDRLEASPERVAAAVPVIRRPDGTDESLVRYDLRHGLAVASVGGRGTPYPSGACSLWRRTAWEALGGLDTAFAPIYWEDADIGARAAAEGWRLLRVPEVRVLHDHAATMGHSPGSMTLRERNRLIFTRKHFGGFRERVLRAVLWMPLHLLKARFTGNRAFLGGYADYRKVRKDVVITGESQRSRS